MTLAWLGALLACRLSCPPGLERTDGHCQQQDVVGVGLGAPLTEEEFQERYDRKLCDAREDCACELVDTGDCEIDLDCHDSVGWPDDCRFDGLAARDCVLGRFTCDVDGDEFSVQPPEICDRVYVCDADTGSTP